MKKILFSSMLMIIPVFMWGIAEAEVVVRKTQLIRGGDYWESVFYQADQQIARQKISAHGVEEQEGEIP